MLTKNGNINDFMLYTLGLRDYSELDKIIERASGEKKQHSSKDYEKSHKKKKSSTLIDILEIFGGE